MKRITRRDFIRSVGAGAALSSCAYLPGGHAFASDAEIRKPRILDPNEKMNVACIGIAGKGGSDSSAMEDENVVALCDVDLSSKKAKEIIKKYPNAKRYADYRVMLAEMDEQIDAVTVSTPDHTHFPAAMMAITMGKHVFCQKPMTRAVGQARALTEAARLHGVATQMGNQHHASEGPRLLSEWIQAGAIGDVREVHLWTDRPSIGWGVDSGKGRPEEVMPVPDGLDWNLWLGTAPDRPYNSAYCPKKWRAWWDFGCGAIGDMACHIMDAAYWSLDLGYPDSVEAVTAPGSPETFPEWAIVTYQFPQRGSMPPVKLVWHDGKKLPERPKELEDDRELQTKLGGQLFYGDKGVVMADAYCESPRIIPEAKMQEFLPNRPPETIPRSPGHVAEWVNACKGGEPAKSNFDYAGPLTEVTLLGCLAVHLGKKIEFDPITMQVANVPEADKFINPTPRAF